MSRPNYVEALLAHFRRTPIGPGPHVVEVRHDEWCRIFKGGVCNCQPEIETGPRVEKKYGGSR